MESLSPSLQRGNATSAILRLGSRASYALAAHAMCTRDNGGAMASYATYATDPRRVAVKAAIQRKKAKRKYQRPQWRLGLPLLRRLPR